MQELAGATGTNPTRHGHCPTPTSQPCPPRREILPCHRAQLPTAPLVIPGYGVLPRFNPYPTNAQAQAAIPSSEQALPRSQTTMSAPGRILQHSTFPAPPQRGPTDVASTPSAASAPPRLSRPSLSDSERDRANKRRREQHTQERPYLREMVAAHAEQRQPQFSIPTNALGKVIGLKTKWHNSIRSMARNIL